MIKQVMTINFLPERDVLLFFLRGLEVRRKHKFTLSQHRALSKRLKKPVNNNKSQDKSFLSNYFIPYRKVQAIG